MTEIEHLRAEINELRLQVAAMNYIAETVGRAGFELSRALVAIMKRHNISSDEIVEELAAFARNRPGAAGGGDHNLENMLSNAVAILIASVGERIIMPAGHA